MKEDFTEYDIKPEGFINYLRYYGQHFNKKLCEFACKQLDVQPCTKEKVDTVLKNNNIELKESKMYDYIYVATWCKYMFYGSSISDEKHFALFLKDIFEKEHSLIFNRWYADMAKKGIPIEWDDMI